MVLSATSPESRMRSSTDPQVLTDRCFSGLAFGLDFAGPLPKPRGVRMGGWNVMAPSVYMDSISQLLYCQNCGVSVAQHGRFLVTSSEQTTAFPWHVHVLCIFASRGRMSVARSMSLRLTHSAEIFQGTFRAVWRVRPMLFRL